MLGAAVDTTAICCICKYRRHEAKHERAVDEVAGAMISKQRPTLRMFTYHLESWKVHNKYIKCIAEYVRKIRDEGRESLYS